MIATPQEIRRLQLLGIASATRRVLSRIAKWQDEAFTNTYGMAEFARPAIDGLRERLRYLAKRHDRAMRRAA